MWWVARREMEIRSRRLPRCREAAYNGVLVPLALCGFLVCVLLNLQPRAPSALFALLACPYAAYLVLAASMMTAGSLAAEVDCARHLPVSAWSLLAGKMLGSLLPLVLEVLCLATLLGAARASSLLPNVTTRNIVSIILVLAGSILLGALLGPATADIWDGPRQAAARARCATWLYLICYPLALYLGMHELYLFSQPTHTRVLLTLGLLHPFSALGMLTMDPYPTDLVAAVTALTLVTGFMVSLVLSRIRSLLQ